MKKVAVFDIGSLDDERFRIFLDNLPFDLYQETDLCSKIIGLYLQSIIPESLNKILATMGGTGSPSALIIKGLPIEHGVIKSDNLRHRIHHKGKVSEGILIGVTNLMGNHLSANSSEQNGSVIHNITPIKGFEESTSSKSLDPFYLHIENPFDKNNPDFLILYCLDSDDNAETTYYFIEDILSKIPAAHLKTMGKPLFEIRSGSGLDSEEKGVFPLLERKNSGEVRLRLYEKMDRIKPLTTEAFNTLTYIKSVFMKINESGEIPGVSLKKGEVLILNNGWGNKKISGIMHGRKGRIQNPHRWLQRGFLKRNDNEINTIENYSLYIFILEIIKKEPTLGLRVVNDLLGPTKFNWNCALEVKDCISSPVFREKYNSTKSISLSFLHSIKHKRQAARTKKLRARL